MTLRKSGSLFVVWMRSLAIAAPCSSCSGSRSHGTNFATTHFMPKPCVNPQISFSFSHCQSPMFVDCSPYMFNTLRCSACCRPSTTWITFNRFSTIFEVFVLHVYLHYTHCIVPESLLYHPNSFHGGMFKLNAEFDADLLLCSLSHFECDGHTVHMLT